MVLGGRLRAIRSLRAPRRLMAGRPSRPLQGMLLATMCAFAVGCGPTEPPPSPIQRIEIRYMSSDQGCLLAGLPRLVTIRIDPTAAEQVLAVAPNGKQYHMWWARGFVGGRADDRVVLDPDGAVVAHDGQVFTDAPSGPATLRGHMVCAGSNSLFVFLAGPS